MNICIICECWPDINDNGGIGVYYSNLVNYLNLNHTHVYVTVITRGNIYQKYQLSEIIGIERIIQQNILLNAIRYILKPLQYFIPYDLYELSSVLIWNSFAFILLLIINRKRNFDIVETHDYHTTPIFLLISHFAPFIIKLQGWKKITASLNNNYPTIGNYLLHKLEFLTIRNSRFIIANSKITKNLAMKEFGITKCKVIYNSVDTQVFIPSLSSKSNFLLYVGRLEERKGIAILIDAYIDYAITLFKKNESPLPLLCIGQDVGMKYNSQFTLWKLYIEKRLSNLPHDIHIFFLPQLTRIELIYYYQNCAAIVVPSIIEFFGNIVIEALSCNKFILSGKFVGAGELLPKSVCTTFRPDKQSLYRALLQFNRNYKNIYKGYTGRIIVKKLFDSNIIGQQIIKYYSEILSSYN